MGRVEMLAWASCIAMMLAEATDAAEGAAIGANWGTTMASHPMDPALVVEMLKANGIHKVKLFDADEHTLSALAGTGIEVIVAIPNDELARMSSEFKHARRWVDENVTRFDGKVNIKYVAVGNEPFLTSYDGMFINTTFPALRHIQKALNAAGLGDRIKATVPVNADVYASPPANPVPSAGNFRSDIRGLMTRIVRYLNANKSPFVVNIYPFLSLYQNPNFPVEYAFFDGDAKPVDDGETRYANVFDANHDTLVWSLRKAKVPNMKIIVGEIGWPTDGDIRATRDNARRFYGGFLKKLGGNEGTPLRPGRLEAYLFSLFDEDMKSVLPGNFERHWGIFSYDGKPKFKMDVTGKGVGGDKYPVSAKGVEHLARRWCVFDEAEAKDEYNYIGESVDYACSNADCTPLGYGSSCNSMSLTRNISYAFNVYFQTMDQDVRACDFHGLAKITEDDPTEGNCTFPIQIVFNGGNEARGRSVVVMVMVVAVAVMVLILLV